VVRVKILALSALAALAALAVGGTPAAPATGGDDGYWRACGERIVGEALIVRTKSHAVACALARKIAKKYALGKRHPLGFNCTEPEPAPHGEVSKGVCRREGGRVKAIFGI
jgi:hypothetical protein